MRHGCKDVAVGARLPVVAVCQSINGRLTQRYRGQALLHVQCISGYSAFINARQLSSMRLEKPHSLSYQASTFRRRPLTLV